MNNINDIWPFPYPPHNNQKLAFDWLVDNQDKKYLILESPVGSGKSNIGLMLSKVLGDSSFILTPQRILQEQYEQSFKDINRIDLASLYGKSNYTCKTKNTDCSIGGLVKPRCARCPHDAAREKSKTVNNLVMNYKLALTMWAFTQTFLNNKRPLMILDECHTLEEHLVNFDTLSIAEWRCKKYGVKWEPQTNIKAAVDFLHKTYIPAFTQIIEDMTSDIDYILDKPPSDLDKSELLKLKELSALETHIFDETTAYTDVEQLKDKFVMVYDKTMFQFKRLTGGFAFNNIIKPMAHRFLFMSSTVLDKEGFCNDIGIDPEQTAFLSLQSEFGVENRPIYYMPQMKMNYKWTENINGKATMLKNINQLLEIHKDDSGIIHTGNFKIAEWLVDNIKTDHYVFHHNPNSGDERNAIIRAFMSYNKPSVLISPSSTEGLDLKDDLGRFAIVAKIPFGSLGDQWIKTRMNMSNSWYQRRALIGVMQGGGRIVRGMQDTGTVYILDESFGYLYSQTSHLIPKWWNESYIKL
jgi:ATP-dependent DNA helicase DinG